MVTPVRLAGDFGLGREVCPHSREAREINFDSKMRRPNGELPSDPHRQTGTHRSPKIAKSPSQFIVAARAQALKGCETQAPLSGKPLSSA